MNFKTANGEVVNLELVENITENVKVGNYYIAGDCRLWDAHLTKGTAYRIEKVGGTGDKGRSGMLYFESEFEIVDDRGEWVFMDARATGRFEEKDEDDEDGNGDIMAVAAS